MGDDQVTGVARPTSLQKLSVYSEFERLEAVIVHRPGSELDRLTPSNRGRFLFEDILYVPGAISEHNRFTTLLREQGVSVFYFADLLNDIISDDEVFERLMSAVLRAEGVSGLDAIRALSDNYSKNEIVNMFIAGLTTDELRDRTGYRFASPGGREERFILTPIPNAYFTRDPAAVLGEFVISSKMFSRCRVRESILFREVFESHWMFDGGTAQHPAGRFIFGANPRGDARFDGRDRFEERPFTLEGGDVIALSTEAVAIGSSQRTCPEAIERLASNIFAEGVVQRVYEVHIPSERMYMHLDTVFTVISDDAVVAYPNVMSNVRELRRFEPRDVFGTTVLHAIDESRTFYEILKEELSGSLRVIETGGGSHRYAEREQQADGTNVLAIRPGVVVTYERNSHTNEALEEEGVTVLQIEGSELVRGLGGPRCMTMPIRRGSSKGNDHEAD